MVSALVAPDVRAGGLTFDTSGNLYLSSQDSVLKFAPDGTRSTFATGLNNASGLAFDHKGNLFVSDIGTQSIYRFAPNGTKSTFVPKFFSFGLACDSADNLYATQGGSVYKFTPDGTKSTFVSGLDSARDIVIDTAGNIYVLALTNNEGTAVEKFGPDGTKYMFLFSIPIDKPSSLAIDPAGNVYLTKMVEAKGSAAILKFGADGEKNTFAAAEDAVTLGSITADARGNVFVFNGSAMNSDVIRKYDATGARTVSTSPDKQWEYRLVNDHFPEIAKAGEKKIAVDLVKKDGTVDMGGEAVVWAPDSKSFAFAFSPPHAPHTSYDTLVIYQLRGGEWVETTSLVDLQSDLSQVAQLGKSLLSKKLSHNFVGERDILRFRKWVDANTAIVYGYSHRSIDKSRSSEAAYVFTIKFDTSGKWKIVEMHPASAKEKETP